MEIKDMTESQKRDRIKTLKKKIEKLKAESNFAKAMQLALKLVLNGTYGAFCHPAFTVSNAEIANSITASSREVINWMLDLIEDYFYNKWYLDTESHKLLGQVYITKYDDKYYINRKDGTLIDKYGRVDDEKSTGIEKILETYYLSNSDFVEIDIDEFNITDKKYEVIKKIHIADFSKIEPIPTDYDFDPRPDLTNDSSIHLYRGIRSVPLVIYGDTDSLYITYTPIMESIGYKGDELKFILHMNSVFTQPLFNKFLSDYANKYGVKSLHDFELETINKSALHIQKKNYINNVVWESGVFYEDLTHFYPKGVEIIKSSTPTFVRENIWDFIKYLFKNPGNVSIKEILKIMKNLKKEFKLADIEDISMTTSLNNYETKVIDDQNSIETVKGSHFSIKSAALHNFILNKNSDYKTRYNLLSGGRIKWYFTKNDFRILQDGKISEAERFAYLRSFHPTEITIEEDIECDYDMQFEKTFLSIANRFIEPIGLPIINKRLSVLNSLFTPNKKKKKLQKIDEDFYDDLDNIKIISSDDIDYTEDGIYIENNIVIDDEPSVLINKKNVENNVDGDEDFFNDDDVCENKVNENEEIEYDDFWN